MKKLILTVGLMVLVAVLGKWALAADSLTLTDNTLITDAQTLRCMTTDASKVLVLTGSATDTHQIVEDGADIVTITLVDHTEKWTTNHPSRTFKVNWTAVATATDPPLGATLQCIEQDN